LGGADNLGGQSSNSNKMPPPSFALGQHFRP
jgi:hypothetical protein